METALSGAANQVGEEIGQTRGSQDRCDASRGVQSSAPILLASLDYQSRKDSRLAKTRRFGAVRSEPVLHCNRRPPSSPPLSAGVVRARRADDAPFGIPRDRWARFVAAALVPQRRWVLRTVAWPLTARVDPVACPLGRVLQRLLFTLEVIKRIEPVAAFGLRAIDAFEQQVG